MNGPTKAAGWKKAEHKGFRFVEGWGTLEIFADLVEARKACEIAGNKYDEKGWVGVTTEPLNDVIRMVDAMVACN